MQGYQGDNKGFLVCRKKMATSAELLCRYTPSAFRQVQSLLRPASPLCSVQPPVCFQHLLACSPRPTEASAVWLYRCMRASACQVPLSCLQGKGSKLYGRPCSGLQRSMPDLPCCMSMLMHAHELVSVLTLVGTFTASLSWSLTPHSRPYTRQASLSQERESRASTEQEVPAQFTEAVVNLKFDEDPKYSAYVQLFESLCGPVAQRPIQLEAGQGLKVGQKRGREEVDEEALDIVRPVS